MAFEEFTLNGEAGHGYVIEFDSPKSTLGLDVTGGAFTVATGSGKVPAAPVSDPTPAAGQVAGVLCLTDSKTPQWGRCDYPVNSTSPNRFDWISVYCTADGLLLGIAG